MAENLDIHARLTAVNEMSPVLKRVIADFKQFENITKRINNQLSGVGRAGLSSMDGFNRAAQAAAQQMRGLANTGKSAARSMSDDWRKAADQRVSDTRRMFQSLERMEAGYLRQVERRVAAERRAERSAGHGGGGRFGYGGVGRIPGPTARQLAIGGVATAGGIGAALKRRMQSDLSEVKASIFGDLSRDEIKNERRDWIDKSSIKFGESASKIIDSFTESLKAGFGRGAARQITQGALEATSALELDVNQLIKLSGKVATIFGGDVRNVDPKRVLAMMNAIGVAAAETAADPDEIVQGFKKGNAALSMSKLNERDLATLLSVAISSGVQPGKAGNAISNLISTLVGGSSARGQKAKDLDQAARLLGLGSKSAMSRRAADDPMNLLIDMFNRMKSLSDQKRTHVARLLGGESWDDEILQIGNAVDQIISTRKAVEQKTDKIAEASKLKTNSLQGRWSSIVQGFALAFEHVGGGFTDAFEEISDWFRDVSNAFDYSRMTENVRNFVAGIRTGFGYGSWRRLLDDAFGGASAGDAKKYGEIGQGIAEGIKAVWSTIDDVFTSVAKIAGVKVGDTKAVAKFATELLGFTLVLRFLAPLATVLGAVTAFLWRIGKWVEWVAGLIPGKEVVKKAAPKVAGRAAAPLAGWLGMLLYGDGRPDNSPEDFKALQEEFKREREKRLRKEQGKDKNGTPTEFSGRRRTSSAVDELKDQLAKYGAIVERSSFLSGSSGVSTVPIQPALGGASPTALFKSTPGNILPNFGIGSDGIIRRDRVPSFSGTGGSMANGLNRSAFARVFAGTAMADKYDQVVSAAKANGISPALLAGIMAHETGQGKNLNWNNPGGLMTSSGKMRFGSLDTGIEKTASVVAKNWSRARGDLGRMGHIYAPIGAANDPNGLNKHWVGGVGKFMSQMAEGQSGSSNITPGASAGLAEKLGIKGAANFMHGQYGGIGENQVSIATATGKRFTVNAAAAESFKGFVDELEASGYKIKSLGGYSPRKKKGASGWSQHAYGNAIDINPAANPQYGGTDMPANVRDMAAKHGLSWGGDWSRRYRDPMHFEWTGKKPWLDKIPIPADTVKNVPPATTSGVGAGDARSVPGNVAIHINGGSHDPEALATLVQRRIDESMNWRAHDSETEYT
ncbi:MULTISPECIES: phage tail tape measure protein [unclassified Bradyrhizobium]|uniref:phage tail tape measure protein n=1 Tax=unclassified Bradyrhizobium TaxID=2631580 RepID=UPI002916483E|nr:MULTISPECIES: phage tail tape measure protein [unclassified Bradyrhizobium]